MTYIQREYQRIAFRHPAELFLSNRTHCVAETMDISMGGLGLVSFDRLQPTIQGQIKLIYSEEIILQTPIKVMWSRQSTSSNQRWHLGIRFETMSPTSKHHLVQLILNQMQKESESIDLSF